MAEYRITSYNVCYTKLLRKSTLANRLVGDGLVPLHSALGRHEDERRNLAFAESSQHVVYTDLVALDAERHEQVPGRIHVALVGMEADDANRITSYNVCYTKLLRPAMAAVE